jgi:hypothetical protein
VTKEIEVNVNFTIEFWARGDALSMNIGSIGLVNFQKNTFEFKGVQ